MSKNKLGMQPAFPNHKDENLAYPEMIGMSKRFYAACAAMCGILASKSELTTQQIIGVSYECADELLAQENNE